MKSVVDQVRGRAANVDARIQRHPLRRFCDAFGRDWDEPGHEAKVYESFRDLVRAARKQGAKKLFVFGDDEKWRVASLRRKEVVTERSLRPIRA